MCPQLYVSRSLAGAKYKPTHHIQSLLRTFGAFVPARGEKRREKSSGLLNIK